MSFTASQAAAESDASLQELIEQTPEGEAVRLEPGIYAGPVIIEKAVILDGKGRVTIDGQGKGSVLLLKADGVVVKNMIITNSGDSHDRVDAGILVRSSAIGYATTKLKIRCSELTCRKPTRT